MPLSSLYYFNVYVRYTRHQHTCTALTTLGATTEIEMIQGIVGSITVPLTSCLTGLESAV
jgi:hypothetical protein